MPTRPLVHLGRATAARLAVIGTFTLLGLRTLVCFVTPPIRVRATTFQIYLQGVNALGLAAVTSLFTGMALALQLSTGLGRFGASTVVPQLTVLGLVREFGPLISALVVGVRLGAGIAAELGTMAVTEQLDAVRVLGADPVREIVAPRVAAAMIVLPLITVFADLVGSVGSLLVAFLENGIGLRFFVESVRDFVLPADFLSGVGKASGFGAIIALFGCWHGGRASGGADGVGRATTQTVVHSALSVIVLDYFLSRILLPLLARGPGF